MPVLSDKWTQQERLVVAIALQHRINDLCTNGSLAHNSNEISNLSILARSCLMGDTQSLESMREVFLRALGTRFAPEQVAKEYTPDIEKNWPAE